MVDQLDQQWPHKWGWIRQLGTKAQEMVDDSNHFIYHPMMNSSLVNSALHIIAGITEAILCLGLCSQQLLIYGGQ